MRLHRHVEHAPDRHPSLPGPLRAFVGPTGLSAVAGPKRVPWPRIAHGGRLDAGGAMTYGMTKEQLISANGKLIEALRIKERQLAESEKRIQWPIARLELWKD